jgi:hypothetical protein
MNRIVEFTGFGAMFDGLLAAGYSLAVMELFMYFFG